MSEEVGNMAREILIAGLEMQVWCLRQAVAQANSAWVRESIDKQIADALAELNRLS